MGDITRIFFGERGSSLRICCLGCEFVLCRLLGALLLCLHLLLELRGHLDHLEVLHEVLRSVEALDRRAIGEWGKKWFRFNFWRSCFI